MRKPSDHICQLQVWFSQLRPRGHYDPSFSEKTLFDSPTYFLGFLLANIFHAISMEMDMHNVTHFGNDWQKWIEREKEGGGVNEFSPTLLLKNKTCNFVQDR